MEEKESLGWRLVWDFPIIGEVIQTAVLFLPAIAVAFSNVMEGEKNQGFAMLVLTIIEIAWLWALERFGRTRLVLPLIKLPWLWVFIALAGYSFLVMVGLVKPPSP